MKASRRVGSICSDGEGNAWCFSDFRDGVEMSSSKCDPQGLDWCSFVGEQGQAVVKAPGVWAALRKLSQLLLALGYQRAVTCWRPSASGKEPRSTGSWLTSPASVNRKASSWGGEGSRFSILHCLSSKHRTLLEEWAWGRDCGVTLQSLEKSGGFQSIGCQERAGQRGLWAASEMLSGCWTWLKPWGDCDDQEGCYLCQGGAEAAAVSRWQEGVTLKDWKPQAAAVCSGE